MNGNDSKDERGRKGCAQTLRDWARRFAPGVLLWTVSLGVYLLVPASNHNGDTLATAMLPIVVSLHGEIDFTPYQEACRQNADYAGRAYYLRKSRFGLIPAYPPWPGLMLTPFYYPLVRAVEARHRPTPAQWVEVARQWERPAAAAIVATSALMLVGLVRRLQPNRRLAWAMGWAFAFATNAFSQNAQALWQHTTTIFFMLLALRQAWAACERSTPRAWGWAGLWAGLAYACRFHSIVFLLLFLIWVFWIHRPGWARAWAAAAAVALVVLAYNWIMTALPTGRTSYGTVPARLTHPGFVLAAMLFSPSKGLFLYVPFTLVSIAGAVRARRLEDPRLRGFYLFLALYALTQIGLCWLRRWDWWWGAETGAGSRYLSELHPAAFLLLVPLMARPGWGKRLAWASLGLSALLQTWAAVGYPYDNWHAAPPSTLAEWVYSPRHWDWKDNPVSRSLRNALACRREPPASPADCLAVYRMPETPWPARVGEPVEVPVTVRNEGRASWHAYSDRSGRGLIQLAYRQTDPDGAVRREGKRSMLPRTIRPGDEVSWTVRLPAFEKPGRYRIDFDLLEEKAFWFSDRGAPTGVLWVEVR